MKKLIFLIAFALMQISLFSQFTSYRITKVEKFDVIQEEWVLYETTDLDVIFTTHFNDGKMIVHGGVKRTYIFTEELQESRGTNIHGEEYTIHFYNALDFEADHCIIGITIPVNNPFRIIYIIYDEFVFKYTGRKL